MSGFLILVGCARPIGDLGRAQPGVLHDQILPTVGRGAAHLRQMPLSNLHLSDAEIDMRDRFWRYLTAPHAHDWFLNVKAEWERTKLIEALDGDFDRTRYTYFLRSMPVASNAARFGRLRADIKTDALALPGAFKSICTVIKADGARLKQARTGAQDQEFARQLRLRISENRKLIERFTRAIILRSLSYDHALTVLRVETPDERAKPIESDLKALNYWVRLAERRSYCLTPQGAVDRQMEGVLQSRYAKPGYGGYGAAEIPK